MTRQLSAVRTVAETATHRIVEGLAFPFQGRDTYGTFFSARTNFEWPLFDDLVPGATRAGEEPRYIRPTTYHHGFDQDFGLTKDGMRVGGWSPIRTDDDGVWVRAQIDKRHTYYATRLGPLLDAGALGLSGGSAEHSVRIDQKTGEVLDWPAYELALTPVESNPLAQIAARAGDVLAALRIVEDPGAAASIPAVLATAARFSPSAWDASAAAYVLSSLADLIGDEADETEQVGWLREAAALVQKFIGAELAEVGTPEEADEAAADATSVIESVTVTAYASALRAADIARLENAVRSASSILTRLGSGAAAPVPAEGAPAFRLTANPEPPDASLEELATRAAENAAREAVLALRR